MAEMTVGMLFPNAEGVPMKQEIIGSGQGRDYDWSRDHIFVKTASDSTGGVPAAVTRRSADGHLTACEFGHWCPPSL